jgi:hypothetical protein
MLGAIAGDIIGSIYEHQILRQKISHFLAPNAASLTTLFLRLPSQM